MKPAHSLAWMPAMSNAPSVTVLRTLTITAICLFSAAVCSAGDLPRRDRTLQRKVIGTWTTRAFGTQELTNYSDGTARLDVTLNRLAALRYGRSLTLELVWTVKDGVMTHSIKGGSPPEKVKRLVNDWGKTLEYRIVEITDTHMLLVKPNDNEQSRWDAKTELAARN